MRKKLLSGLAIFGTLTLLTLTIGFAGKNGQAGRSNIGHLYLYEKDPSTWEIVPGGAWGKMKYNLAGSTFQFVFNGHGLEAGEGYTLIYYPDPWPGNGLICLGSATANDYGDVHIMASVETNGDLQDAKIWLALSGDVDCVPPTRMLGIHNTEYLFESELISFDDTD